MIQIALIERAQFALNDCTYQPGVYKYDNDFKGSFLEYFLHEMEQVHGMRVFFLQVLFSVEASEDLCKPLDRPLTFFDKLLSSSPRAQIHLPRRIPIHTAPAQAHPHDPRLSSDSSQQLGQCE